MKIKDLEYFECLCQEKSFTKVAARLFVSQPAISLSIQRLERELNSQLIIRNKYSKDLRITKEGIIFRHRAKNILSELQEAKAELLECKSKKFKFGIPPIIGTYFIPKYISKFSNKEFVENIEFIQSGSIKMRKMLDDGTVDMALLGSLEPIVDKTIKSTVLAKNKFVLCISKNNPITKEKKLSFDKLKEQQFIVLGDENIHLNVLKELFLKYNIDNSKICYVTDIQTAKTLIVANFGVGIIVDIAVKNLKGIKIIDLEDEIPFYISIGTKKGHYISKLESHILDTIKEIKNNI